MGLLVTTARFVAIGLLLTTACQAETRRSTAPLPYQGVNLAGGEFAPDQIPGKLFTNYVYPDASVAQPFVDAGMTIARVPVLWERIQPEPFKPLSDSEMAAVDASLSALGGFKLVILDVHNYAEYRRQRLDQNPQGAAMLADLWKRLADRYKGKSNIAFGIMNEPHDMLPTDWRKIADASVTAIRATGAKNLLLVPGADWTGAHSWVSSGNGAAFDDFKDPGKNFLFEMHQYFDHNNSGTTDTCSSAKVADARMAEATNWLRARKAKALLGEFGGTKDQVCLDALDDALGFMSANPDVWQGWTYWAAGGWWGGNALSIQPENGKDKPQMAVLKKYLRH